MPFRLRSSVYPFNSARLQYQIAGANISQPTNTPRRLDPTLFVSLAIKKEVIKKTLENFLILKNMKSRLDK